MPVNTYRLHESIGLFQPKPSFRTSTKFRVLRFVNYKVIAFLILLLLCHGDIKVKPGPKEKFQNFYVVTGM